MTQYEFQFPDDYDSEAPIIEAKGWMIGTLIVAPGTRYTHCFCCPVRLGQDVEAEFELQPCFTQRNLVVVPEVTKSCVLAAVEWLVKGSSLSDFVPD